MKIAHIDLGKYPILLAPMEDVTDPAFRLMCKRFGADMVYTEFVSSDALIRAVSKTAQKLSISDAERPVAIQIYGKDTETMVAKAAGVGKLLLGHYSARYNDETVLLKEAKEVFEESYLTNEGMVISV
jgi:2-methylisocitrate lyase-like PEP mutase family enzyme